MWIDTRLVVLVVHSYSLWTTLSILSHWREMTLTVNMIVHALDALVQMNKMYKIPSEMNQMKKVNLESPCNMFRHISCELHSKDKTSLPRSSRFSKKFIVEKG